MRAGGRAVISSGISTAIQGGSFGDNFNAALLGEAGNVAMATGFNWVGDTIKFPDGSIQKIAAHALMGGLLAEATGSDFKTGAAAAGLNEALINQLAWAARGNDDITLMLSQLTGLLAAAAVDGDLEKGSEIAQKASTYNWLTHREIEDADKARAGCSALGAGAGACEKKIIRDMDELDKSRNLGMFDLERTLQLSVLRDGMTQGEYREALLDGFNGLDPKDLVFTGYAPANELGYRAEALGSHVVDLAAEFPGRFKAGLEGLINNYDQIPAGIAQSARDGVDWWTGPIPAQAIGRAEDKLVFSTPEQLGDRLFDMTLGTAAGAAGGLVGGKAIEWFAGRWATRAGAEGVGAKEVAGVPKSPNVTSAITDAEAGTSGLPKLGSLKGEPELPPKNASPDMVRSIERQNEASKKLAQAGFDVEQLANTGRKGGNPDLQINGDLADVFSPRTNSPISVLMTVTEKVEKQASSVVVNLADSPLTFGEIEKALLSRPVEGLKKLYLMKNNEFRVIEASK